MKFAIKLVQYYLPHLRHVATLPWEIKKSFFADKQEKKRNFDIFDI